MREVAAEAGEPVMANGVEPVEANKGTNRFPPMPDRLIAEP